MARCINVAKSSVTLLYDFELPNFNYVINTTQNLEHFYNQLNPQELNPFISPESVVAQDDAHTLDGELDEFCKYCHNA